MKLGRVAVALRNMLRDRWFASALASARSLSDMERGYLEVCAKAPTDEGLFDRFRREPAYTRVLEHVTPEQGLEYFALLSPSGRALSHLSEIAATDAVGGPVQMRLPNGHTISPSTLRYLKVADDIERMFENLDGANVIEIGVGYGGQCRVLMSCFPIRSYTLVDLEPALNLARSFLSNFSVDGNVEFRTMDDLGGDEYDFALSNYAFSELARPLQEHYFERVLSRSQAGYITFNDIAPSAFKSWRVDEYSSRLQARIFPECPLTHERNCVVVWDHGEAR